jgi:hypothetical protein
MEEGRESKQVWFRTTPFSSAMGRQYRYDFVKAARITQELFDAN